MNRTIRDSVAKPDTLTDLSVDAFLLLDENLNLLNINDVGNKLFGVSGVDAFGKCIVDIMPDIKKSGIYKKCRNVLKTGESVIMHQKLGDRSLAVHVFKLGDSLGVIVRDITERKRAEEERELVLVELAEKTKELEQVIHLTSHDLRSPLVNIQGFTRELEEAYKKFHEVLNSETAPLH